MEGDSFLLSVRTVGIMLPLSEVKEGFGCRGFHSMERFLEAKGDVRRRGSRLVDLLVAAGVEEQDASALGVIPTALAPSSLPRVPQRQGRYERLLPGCRSRGRSRSCQV